MRHAKCTTFTNISNILKILWHYHIIFLNNILIILWYFHNITKIKTSQVNYNNTRKKWKLKKKSINNFLTLTHLYVRFSCLKISLFSLHFTINTEKTPNLKICLYFPSMIIAQEQYLCQWVVHNTQWTQSKKKKWKIVKKKNKNVWLTR